MIFRNKPDPKDKAKASKIPITTANSKAVDTDGNSFLSVTSAKGLPLLLSSRECFSVQKSVENKQKSSQLIIHTLNL